MSKNNGTGVKPGRDFKQPKVPLRELEVLQYLSDDGTTEGYLIPLPADFWVKFPGHCSCSKRCKRRRGITSGVHFDTLYVPIDGHRTEMIHSPHAHGDD